MIPFSSPEQASAEYDRHPGDREGLLSSVAVSREFEAVASACRSPQHRTRLSAGP